MSTLPLSFPPTPAPSIHSSVESDDPETPQTKMSYAHEVGPSSRRPSDYFPPTPPSMGDSPVRSESPYGGTVDQLPSETHFPEQLRKRRARRPVSVHPPNDKPPFMPPRKYTDPTPRSRSFLEDTEELSPNPQQLDVDLEAYSVTDYDGDDSRAPTLSFVTTSTDSTTGTPPIGTIYGRFRPDQMDGKSEEPRIRLRSTAGRTNAYSSAESSMGSGAYSFHSYSDNVYHPHPPPLPVMPLTFAHDADRIGLGISAVKSPISPTDTSSSVPPSPASYQHRPWHRDISKHIRNESASSATSGSTEDESTSPDALAYRFDGYKLSDHIPWGQAKKEAKALLTVEEGRERMFDAARLQAMGGVDNVDLQSLAGVTHLLLANIGSAILPILNALIEVLAPSLLVADLSENDLSFLPENLRRCSHLEELNVSGNPLRQLPVWLAEVNSLQVLVVDGCGLSGIPGELSHLRHLHTVCARRNKLVSLPAWFCLLTQLETLRVDDNPFAPEWQPIVQPILAGPSRSRAPTPYDPLRPAPSMKSLNSSTSTSSVSHDWPQGTLRSIAEDAPHSAPLRSDSPAEEPSKGSHRLRKMRSAGTLLNLRSFSGGHPDEALSPTATSPASTPGLPSLQPPNASRFDSYGSAVVRRSSVTQKEEEPSMTASTSGKSGKWGFLRKMSMNRLRADKSTLTASASSNIKLMPPPLHHQNSEPGPSRPARPGLLTAQSMTLPSRMQEEVSEFGLPNPATMFGTNQKRGKRRSFLPIDPTPPSINVSIPTVSPFMASPETFNSDKMEILPTLLSETTIADETLTASSSLAEELQASDVDAEARYAQGLESIKSYLRDLFDLSRPVIEPYGGFEVVPDSNASDVSSPASGMRNSISDRRRQQCLDKRCGSSLSGEISHHSTEQDFAPIEGESGKKFKNDRAKRARVLREIYETERTYVRGLGELVNIYVRPSAQPVKPGQAETIVPSSERKIVFGGIESILSIHRENLLPALEKAVKPLLEGEDDEDGRLSAHTAHVVGEVFRTYIAYMKQYSTYINNFDNALSRMKSWITSTPAPAFGKTASPTIASIAGLAATGAAGSVGMTPTNSDGVPLSGGHMNAAQKKRVKHFVKRCREHPLHSQINLESYLLLPVQRVPRYKLLLEDLAMCTPPQVDGPRDTLDDALNEIAGLASLMNEEKRDAESRLRLYHWQKRITSRGPSPLVQPHRKLILDGALNLIRLVKKSSSFVEVDTTVLHDGDATVMPSKAVVPIEHIKPEPMDRQMMLILCTDLMVLAQPRCQDGREGMVDLYNVLRMSTVREPASIVYGDILRVVDNKSIYYFSGSSPTNVLEWCRAINSARRR